MTTTDENGHVAKAQQLVLEDGQSDLLLDKFVATFMKQAERDFDEE